MIDSKGRLFGKISILDVAVVLLAIGMVIGLVYRFHSSEALPIINANKKFYITLIAERVRDYSVNATMVGDVVFEQHQKELGTIVEVRSEQAYDILKKSDGTAVYAPVEDKFNMYTVIECIGNINSSGYYINGNKQVSVGSEIPIQSNSSIGTNRVWRISETLEQ